MLRKFLTTVVLFAVGILMANAQSTMDLPKVPADPAVKIGVLDNGMTYYIRHNDKPANQGDFYIVHDVGAIQEEDSQIGLAHFLEHMAFNGTKNMPDNMIIEYLESIGVKFGANLNAGTGQELTIYNIASVPLTREGIIDTALLILHDWSHFITLDPKEVDAERGVIIEELRTGNNANFRIREKTWPVLFNESKYAYRNIIGEEDHLRNFPHQDLVDFYHRWYRPDLQAIVLVGDFDVEVMEAKLIKLMADVPAVENPEPKEIIRIPGNVEPLISVATDPELRQSSVSYYIKHQPLPDELKDTRIAIARDNVNRAIATMANYRLAEITQKPNAPFTGANFGTGSMVRTMDMFYGGASARDGETAQALEALLTEVERIRRYGFTHGELERVQEQMLRSAETAYEGRFDKKNNQYVWEYVMNFLENSPIPTSEHSWEIDSTTLSSLDLENINEYAQEYLKAENEVVIISSPEKEEVAVPTEEEIANIIAKVRQAEIAPPADDVKRVPLIGHELTAGKVVKSEEGEYESTIWTLDNGARIILKPTDLKADEVIGNVRAEGGISNFSDEDYISAEFLRTFVPEAGLGQFSKTELQRQLSGKVARIAQSINRFSTGFSTYCSPKDFETLLQLLHLYYTAPRFEQDDFEVVTDRLVNRLQNVQRDPNFLLQQELMKTLYDGNERMEPMTLERLEKVDFNKLEGLYKQLYNNIGDFTFTFVGNFDMEVVKPLIEKYIGSIKAADSKLEKTADGVGFSKGENVNRFATKMEAPKSTVFYAYTGDVEYTPENTLTFDALRQALSSRYLVSIREEKGGTYGVGVYGGLVDYPKEQFILQIYFDTDPDLADELMEIVDAEFEKIAAEGPLTEDIVKFKEFETKQHPANLKENGTWVSYLTSYYFDGIDHFTDFEKLLKELDGEKVQKLAKKILESKNLVKVIMDPEKEE